MSPHSTQHDSDPLASVREATLQLRAIDAGLRLGDAATQTEMRAFRGYSYVSTAAARAAIGVLVEHAADLPLSDAERIAARVAAAEAMTALAEAATALARRVEQSAIKQRGEAGRDVVAMYASLKAMAKYCARARPGMLRMREVLWGR